MKAVVLHSGGLDSTTCLLLAQKKEEREVVSLGIDYGQGQAVEMQYAARQCEQYGIPRKVLSVNWDKPSVTIPLDRSIEEMRQGSPAFLPGRNIIFLSLAAAEAVTLDADEIWIGVNSVDFSGYPDCTPDFLQSFATTLRSGLENPPDLRAPLLSMDKQEIARVAHQLGITPSSTWSCYRPQPSARGLETCGRCDACVLHSHAWKGVPKKE